MFFFLLFFALAVYGTWQMILGDQLMEWLGISSALYVWLTIGGFYLLALLCAVRVVKKL